MTAEETRRLARRLEVVANSDSDGEPQPFRLLSVRDLAALPRPEYLLDELLPARGLSVLFGPSGVGKSFLALDWSLCLATGLAWYGKAAQAGSVLYLAAEGVGGLSVRVNAWRTARDRDEVKSIRFLPEAVNLLDRAQVARAVQTLGEMPTRPTLIVVDTMARTMVGGDENAARDVGLFVDAVDSLRAAVDAAALIVHHTGKNGEEERGSSALRGAADAMFSLKPDGSALRLECVKTKDAERPDPWTLHLRQVGESCVLRPGSDPDTLSDAERQILESLPGSFGSDPAPAGRLQAASGVTERTFYRAVQSLVQRGFLVAQSSGRVKRYSLTLEGEEELLPTTANHCQEAVAITATATPPLRGGSDGSNPGSDPGWGAS